MPARRIISAGLALLTSLIFVLAPTPGPAATPELLPPSDGDCAVASLEHLALGGEPTYSPVWDRVAYTSRPDKWSTFALYTMRPDGTDSRLVAPVPGGPAADRHRNAPYWHPSGAWLAVQVEQANTSPANHSAGYGMFVANGFKTDIWVVSADGQRWVQLTDYTPLSKLDPSDPQYTLGALGPHFSPDGRRLLWSRMVAPSGGSFAFGRWRLMLADFVVTPDGTSSGTPSLANVQDITPAGASWVEPHGFSPDSDRALFTADIGLADQTGQDEWTLDLTTGQLTNLTSTPGEWDEHARYAPNGQRLVWMSSRPYAWKLGDTAGLKTELLLMDADGGNARQVTHFNTLGWPEYRLEKQIVGGSDWLDGRHVLLTTVWGLWRYPERHVWMVTFAGPCGG
jgi:hypothetical protein